MQPNFLVVDDEPRLADLISQVLKRTLGADVLIAHDSSSAFRFLQNGPNPDLIISDYNRPGENGYEFLVAIKSDSASDRIPVAIISGKISDRQELELFRAGAAFVLRKPFAVSQLTQKTRQLLKLPQDRLRDLIRIGREARDLDYKAEFDVTNRKARAGLAKDVIAMANSGGGNIVVGISEEGEKFTVTGVSDQQLQALETTKLNDAIQTYTGPLAVVLSKLEYEGKRLAVITIPAANELIFPRKEHPEAQLFLGRIYHRTNAARSEEVRDSSEATKLIEGVSARRIRLG